MTLAGYGTYNGFAWTGLDGKSIDPPLPLKVYVESFSDMGEIVLKFNQGLKTDSVTLEQISDMIEVEVEPFDITVREIDPEKFKFDWEPTYFSPEEGTFKL